MADVATSGAPGQSTGAQDTQEQVKEKAQNVAGQAKEQAQQLGGRVQEQARTQVDERSTQFGRQVSGTAGDIRSVGEELRRQGKDGPARAADEAAQRAERLGSYLTESDADRLLGDAEDFARRRPWAVVLGGLALGFAASRFLKASSGERYRSSLSQAEGAQPVASNGTGTELAPTSGTGAATPVI